MANTTNLLIPLLTDNMLAAKTGINNALIRIDFMTLNKSHAESKSHWPMWAANTVVAVGDILRVEGMPSWGYFKCTKEGTTGATSPTVPYGVGDVVTDGSSEWSLEKLGGEVKHSVLTGRNLPDQHAIGAITDLQTTLDDLETNKAEKTQVEIDIATAKQEAIDDGHTYTDTKITELVNGAPEALNTLKELSDALGSETDAVAALTNTVANMDAKKVDKVAGKGLSTNDFDNTAKTKLDCITVSKSVNLNTISDNSHTHTNKLLLDSYMQTEANIADSVSKKHAHANLPVLEKFTSTTDNGVAFNNVELSTLTKKDIIKFSLIF